MRIFSMIASLAESGGAEMLVRNLSLEYARRGHICHVAYISDAASLGASRAFEQTFIDELDAAGITHGALGHATKRNLPLGAWRLRRAIGRFRPDIVHIHLGYGLLFQAIGLVRRPTVYTHHNIVFKFPTRLFRLFDRFVARYVAICRACERLLEPHVARPVVLIPNGVPARFAATRARTRVPRDVAVLSVGNLTPQKDYPTLLAAAALLVPAFAAEGRRIVLRIAGEGGERAALEASIATLGLGDHVELLGARSDIPALMAEADLLVMTSAWEGLPLSLIEATMAGLPAVATDVGGCDEIVADGESGYLVPPGDPQRIAGAVRALLAEDAHYAMFSAAAAERGKRFSLASCVDAHLALYAAVAKR